jgi:hypothetical protein
MKAILSACAARWKTRKPGAQVDKYANYPSCKEMP